MEFLKFIKTLESAEKPGKTQCYNTSCAISFMFKFKYNIKQQTVSEHESEQERW